MGIEMISASGHAGPGATGLEFLSLLFIERGFPGVVWPYNGLKG